MLLTVSLWLSMAVVAPADSVPKRASLLPLPLLFYSPETRLGYGAALTVTFRFRRDLPKTFPTDSTRIDLRPDIASAQTPTDRNAPRPSQITFGVAYSQNQQALFYLPFQIFYAPPAHPQTRYFFVGEVGYYRYSYYFFGLGQRNVPPELYGVNYPRIRLNGFRQIAYTDRGHLYAGLRYQFEDFRVTTTEAAGLLATGAVPGGLGSRLSGGGLGLFYDTRDQLFFPRRGLVADLTWLVRNRATDPTGAVSTFDRYAVDVSAYRSLGLHTVLAVNGFANFTVGTAPFNALALPWRLEADAGLLRRPLPGQKRGPVAGRTAV